MTQMLGKKAPRIDSRTLKLARYLAPAVALPPPPAEVSWVTEVPAWPMYLNDQLGDCVCAAMAHCLQQWSFYGAGTEITVPDHAVLKAYEDISGYDPTDPSTDNGCVMLDALKYWKRTGIGGHKILAYMSVDWTNATELFQAIELFGSVFTGLALPVTAQSESAWTVPPGGPINNAAGAPGTWGGHCVPIMAASPHSRTCVTWGSTLKMSPNFANDYIEEAYVVLSPDWFSKIGMSPAKFNMTQLTADLAQL